MADIVLPDDTQSLFVIGKNGTGKSRAAVWHLSTNDLANTQWIVINHKREEFINGIPGAQFMNLDQFPEPDKKGVFIYQPRPETDDEVVTQLIWKVYHRGNMGVYVDEGYMINPRDPAMTALYTQGRSKRIPLITLSQRPSRCSRFAISEATFYQIFFIVDKRDRKTLEEFVPIDFDDIMGRPRKLKDYHSIYYDNRDDDPIIMLPVPSDDDIYATFAEKLLIPEQDELNLPPLEDKTPPKLKFL